MIRAMIVLFVVATLYAPGRLFALLAAMAILCIVAARAWRRGNRLPAVGAAIMILAATAAAWHGASAIRAFRDARRSPPPLVDGAHEGVAGGLRGPLRVRVEVREGRIRDVVLLSCADSPSIAGEALEETRRRIVEANSPRVPTAHGARTSTAALCRAVEEALWSARGPGIEGQAHLVLLLESNVPRGTTFACLVLLVVVAGAALAIVDSAA